jgi:hypothetical protein
MLASQRRKVKAKDTPPDNVSELLEADIISKEQEMKPLLGIQQKMVKKLKGAQSLLTEKRKGLPCNAVFQSNICQQSGV